MPNKKKKVSMNVIHILKSVMDYKVKPLRDAVDAGKRAAQEEPVICNQIGALQHFIESSRYDRAEALEAEHELADYEMQASAIREKINRGNAAAEQLQHANKFYAMYKETCKSVENASKLRTFIEERAELEDRITKLERNMEACEINMTPDLYNANIADQSRIDYEYYSQEYNKLYDRLQQITWAIESLQK